MKKYLALIIGILLWIVVFTIPSKISVVYPVLSFIGGLLIGYAIIEFILKPKK